MRLPPLTQRPAWKALARHHEAIRDAHLRTLFADDPGRGECPAGALMQRFRRLAAR